MPTSLPSSTASGTSSATSLPSNVVSGTPSVPTPSTTSLPSNVVSGTPSATSLPSNVVSGTPSASGADTTAPVTNTLTFNGTTGTLTWTETQTPPVLNAPGLTSINVAGAGTSAANGNYTIQSSPDAYGCKYFQLGSSEFIYYNTSVPATPAWALGTILNGYHAPSAPTNSAYGVQYGVSGGAASSFPISGWATFFASNPVPTFTPNNGTTVWQANQGLTITGLSGGAVTVSGVTTSGTTTTFTTSRAISFMETSGTFSGVVGAFSDSVSTPNLTAAFSILITRSMFPTTRIVNCTTVIMF